MWDKWEQDPRLSRFWELIYQNKDWDEQYIYIPVQNDIMELISHTDLKLVYSELRENICQESSDVLTLAKECRFWVLQK